MTQEQRKEGIVALHHSACLLDTTSIPELLQTPMDKITNSLAVSYSKAYAPYTPTPTPLRTSTNPFRSPKTTTLANTTMPAQEEPRRASNSSDSHIPALHPARTRSVGGFLSADVIFERDPASPPTDEDIIIVTVRVSQKERRNSFNEPLPDR